VTATERKESYEDRDYSMFLKSQPT